MRKFLALTLMCLAIEFVWAQEEAADRAVVVRVETTESPSLLDMLRRGGPLMYPLYLCSLVVLAVAIERSVRLRRGRILPRETVDTVQRMTREAGKPNPLALLREVEQHRNPIARVITAGLRRADQPLAEMEKAIEDAGQREADAMRRSCRVLSIVASISPLLGLLGTVLGMIKAFMTVAAREEALGRTDLLAAGIYQALVTTATGLAIAIPALVLYYIFVEKVDQLVSEMDDLSIELVESLRVANLAD